MINVQRARQRETTAARVHLVAFAVWVLTWVVAVVLAGGETQIAVDTPAEVVQLVILFVSCFATVISAVVGRLEAGGTRATFGSLMVARALLGGLVPSAIRKVRRPRA